MPTLSDFIAATNSISNTAPDSNTKLPTTRLHEATQHSHSVHALLTHVTYGKIVAITDL
eukprot:gene43204-53631_t